MVLVFGDVVYDWCMWKQLCFSVHSGRHEKIYVNRSLWVVHTGRLWLHKHMPILLIGVPIFKFVSQTHNNNTISLINSILPPTCISEEWGGGGGGVTCMTLHEWCYMYDGIWCAWNLVELVNWPVELFVRLSNKVERITSIAAAMAKDLIHSSIYHLLPRYK